MNNFISTFEELNKLYEEASKAEIKKNSENFGRKKEEACTAKSIAEAADSEELEVVDDEAFSGDGASIDDINEEEPRRVICECDKCGALVIKDEADIVVDEETDLVNVEDACQFCEEAVGYKIVGIVAPYEAAEAEEEVVEESLNNSELLKEIGKTNELKTEHESECLTLNEEEDIIDEDIADIYRKTFDKPASTKTQQQWEDELNGEMGEISDKRRKHLERKFAQQRDWEARHTPDLDEGIFNKKPTVADAQSRAVKCLAKNLIKGDIIVGDAWEEEKPKEGIYKNADRFSVVKQVKVVGDQCTIEDKSLGKSGPRTIRVEDDHPYWVIEK